MIPNGERKGKERKEEGGAFVKVKKFMGTISETVGCVALAVSVIAPERPGLSFPESALFGSWNGRTWMKQMEMILGQMLTVKVMYI